MSTKKYKTNVIYLKVSTTMASANRDSMDYKPFVFNADRLQRAVSGDIFA